MSENEAVEYKKCEYCDGKGVGWSIWGGTGKCGTCQGSGVLPLRGYYYINEDPPPKDETK